MIFNLNNDQLIYPGERTQVNFWTKKWGINTSHLNQAILETGSIRSSVIRKYLEDKGILFSFSTTFIHLKKGIKALADNFKAEE